MLRQAHKARSQRLIPLLLQWFKLSKIVINVFRFCFLLSCQSQRLWDSSFTFDIFRHLRSIATILILPELQFPEQGSSRRDLPLHHCSGKVWSVWVSMYDGKKKPSLFNEGKKEQVVAREKAGTTVVQGQVGHRVVLESLGCWESVKSQHGHRGASENGRHAQKESPF